MRLIWIQIRILIYHCLCYNLNFHNFVNTKKTKSEVVAKECGEMRVVKRAKKKIQEIETAR